MTAIEEIKQRIDIVDFISRYTPLQRAGSSYKGNCPFHNERTPSFIVTPDRNSWYCFGACATGGDVFEFLMRKENLTFPEALEILAKEAGVELHGPDEDPARRQRTSIYEVNAAAAAYFQEILRHHPAAAGARAYLERRQIDGASAERFAIGFALDSWDGLRNHLLHLGHQPAELLAAGVIKENAEQTSSYDVFRGRVIIPIRDTKGRIIGFGGRVLDDAVPKYLNTPETAIFHKSKSVYGIDLAQKAIRAANKVVIVEGYMDVIAAHQHGFSNVVACMGTAITSDQLQQLQRYTENFVLALDADAAGQQATIRGLNQAREALKRHERVRPTARGLAFEQRLAANLQIVSMPDGRDPDDVIRQNPAAWAEMVENARPLVDFYFRIVADQFDLTNGPGKGAAVSALAPLIAELGDDIEREHYARQLSDLVNISLETIEERLRAAVRTQQVRQRRGQDGNEAPAAARHPSDSRSFTNVNGAPQEQAPAPGATLTAEDHFLSLLLHAPDLVVWLAQACEKVDIEAANIDDFERVENREIYRTLRQFIVGDNPWDSSLFQEELTEELHGHYGRIMAYGATHPPSDLPAMREDAAKTLLNGRIRRLQAKNREIYALQQAAQQANDRSAAAELFSMNNQIIRQLSHLQRLLKHLNELLLNRDGRHSGVLIR